MKAVLLALAALPLAGGAFASPCGDKIASLQKRYDAAPIVAGAAPVSGPAGGAAETASAKLHHQPAAASPADAKDPAMSQASVRNAQFRDYMTEAKAADDSGDASTCESSVAKAQRVYSQR
jgi:hypothetical protein